MRVNYRRMPIEVESPEQLGYDTITNNLSESSVADRRLSDLGLDLDVASLDDLLLCYGDHLGDPHAPRGGRRRRGRVCSADDVLVMPGAAAALFATATSLLEPGDHAVVVRTNYATNLETPRAIGADLDVVDLSFDDGWRLDVERVAARVRPGVDQADLGHVPAQPDRHDARPRHAARAGRVGRAIGRGVAGGRDVPRSHARRRRSRWPPRSRRARSACRRCRRRTACPGLRVGWAVCRDPQLAETLLAAKEQMFICGATLDEAIAGSGAGRSRPHPPADPRRRARPAGDRAARGSHGQDIFEWVEPAGGVVGLVRFTPEHRGRHRPLLRPVARGVRHVRRAGPLVRGRRPTLPARLRLADREGVARRSRRARRPRPPRRSVDRVGLRGTGRASIDCS